MSGLVLIARSFYCGNSLDQDGLSRRNPDDLDGLRPAHSKRVSPLLIGSNTTEVDGSVEFNPARGHDRVLILTPLKNAAAHVSHHIKLLTELTYPHQDIDLAFLVGDSKDDTFSILKEELERIQREGNPARFKSAMIFQKDFGDSLGQTVDERHGFRAQASRRKSIGRARNFLLYNALRPVHDWVYWRDVDIVENPSTILEDFMKHDKDILVPSKS